ncbi:hypothetical protein H2201_002255 [Coniosporium apollinis]|uniref:MOSC domain-containing protein n=1 Tax=Coniosporium apollinis TaxID=61459 RepID=A0ABQ9P2D0_9PEZI|nr:hypothetical protein H2201_002255 [Coniosporium apollinis]
MELGQAFMIALFTLLALNATIMYFFFYKDAPSSPPQEPQQPQQSLPPPTEILSLRIYPIKSCRGFSVPSALLLKTGLDLDRNWMFIDASTRKFLTIRQLSKMTLVDTSLSPDDDTLTISIRNHADARISIPAHPSRDWLEAHTTLRSVDIWGTSTDAWEYAPNLTAPFSEFFAKDVRLVYKGPTPRILRGNGAPEHLGRTEATKFADLAPVQVSSMASMDELNSRLKAAGEKEISIERFRPNIVVRGSVPWAEDSWKTLRIASTSKVSEEKTEKAGELVLDVAARCARCLVPNVDPDTAEKHKRQPWDMLMKYRVVDEGITYKPCFGMLCVPREEGRIEVGMSLEVTEVTGDHRYIKGM